MSVFRRFKDVFQQRANSLADKMENPEQALDLSYEKQLEALQQVKRSVADMLTSERRLEIQSEQLKRSQANLEAQARQALQGGREDLAKVALTRSQVAAQQQQALQTQIEQLKQQEQKLEVTAQKLTAKVQAFRAQKETMKAQYSAAKSATQAGEAVTGLSEQMADVSLMIDRAKDKTDQMQARADAVGQLMDSGVLESIGGGTDLDSSLTMNIQDAAVEGQLAAMKQQLGLAGPSQQAAPGLPAPAQATLVARIHGEHQYRLPAATHAQIDDFDRQLLAAIDAGDTAKFNGELHGLLAFVRSAGTQLGDDDLTPSDVMLPSDDMTLDEARQMLQGAPSGGAATPAGAPATS